MRLKRLEMAGFKSFVERTVLNFTPGITAIVGPNGCGKSNIVDALRWVMGEQSARHLRGHLMEDIIFNGSESLPPTGMAEVSLTMDNEDGRGPVEYSSFSEIMVTRRLFRSGESEYSINKVPCRLKDIIELFLGTGVGNKAYSIVEQGRVDEMVNAKPEERRALIEEAAGTSKYKSRKLVAERKLERTQQNLLRVGDIVREIERQIRSLELQAKKAERYRALKEDFKQKELVWAGLQKMRLDNEISLLEEKLKDVDDRSARLSASLHSSEAGSEALKLSLLESEKSITVQQEDLYQRKLKIQSDEQRIEFYRRSRDELGESSRKARAELRQMEEKSGALNAEIEAFNKAASELAQLTLSEDNYLSERETELERIRVQGQSLQTELDRDKELLIETANQVVQLKNELHSQEKRREEWEMELARIRREKLSAGGFLVSWKQKREENKALVEESLSRLEAIEREKGEVQGRIGEWSASKEDQEHRLDGLKERLQKHRSELLSLEALRKNYEGVQEGVRSILLKKQAETSFDGVYGLVADVVEAPESYEKALTAVLGERLQYIIVRSHEEGIEAIEYLKRESRGRGSFIPLGLRRMGKHSLPLTEPEILAPLLERVSVKDGYRELAEYLLGDVVLVRDLKSALDLWNRNGFVSTLVTPEGEVIDPLGVVTGGSADSLEANLLSQRRRMKELQALVKNLEEELKSQEKELESIRERMSQSETRKEVLVKEGHNLALERLRLQHEHAQAAEEVRRLEELCRTLDEEESDLSSRLLSLSDEIKARQKAIEGQIQAKKEGEKGLVDKEGRLACLRQDAERLEAEATESRVRGAALREKKENTQQHLDNRRKLEQELSGQVHSYKSHLAEMEQKMTDLEASILTTERSTAEGKQLSGELEARLGRERLRHREDSLRLSEIEESIRELRPQVEACQAEKNEIQLRLSEKRLHLQHLHENIREKYGEDLKETRVEDSISSEELSREIEELRSRIERMGEVNLAAIGEYEELNSRYSFLNQQKQDLEKSLADLQRTIAKLNRICRLRFRESFEEINQRFEEIFPRLFRGGRARLVLTDENDYLETGVDIIVQPPGKKLQAITLLSGGEKALTAVSLLFAIFLCKPSPFCFLDEVDAPLDDANIDRFIDMIKEMSQSSQFTLITHNKRSMQAAEVLYGITMEEPGVSKVVSVRMN